MDEKDSTAAEVLGPTPRISSSHCRASSGGISARKSKFNEPTRRVTSCSAAGIERAFISGQRTIAIAGSMSSGSASRTFSHDPNLAINARRALLASAFRVR